MNLSQIFEKEPPIGWGSRGNPYFWEYLKEKAKTIEKISPRELEDWIKNEYYSLTGKVMTGQNGDYSYIEAFAHGGMSSGIVWEQWWVAEGIPLLIDRLKSLN